MNKTEFINAVAEQAKVSKGDASRSVEAALRIIEEAMACGEKVSLVGFGVFEVHERISRTGKNPRTGEAITIPSSKLPVFRASKSFKEYVNDKN